MRRFTVTLARWVSQKWGALPLPFRTEAAGARVRGSCGHSATGIYYREVSAVSFGANGQIANVHSLPRIRGGLRRILRVSIRGRGDVRRRSDREARRGGGFAGLHRRVRSGEFTGFGFILLP